MLYQRFVSNIVKNGLINKNDTVIAAVSGGADSVCMLHLLYRFREDYNIKIICAHMNHLLRETASRDEEFVKSLCAGLNITFELKRADIGKIAAESKIPLELAGRNERYLFFSELKDKYNAEKAATAHNKNDVAETLLLHLIRGCGISGLTGIPPQREDGIVRPMLCFTRSEIENYLTCNSLDFCYDETNSDIQYTRNRIRHVILPEIEKINPSFVESAAKSAELIRGEDEYIGNIVKNKNAVKITDASAAINIGVLLSVDKAIAFRIILSALKAISRTPQFSDCEKIYMLVKMKNGSIQCLSDKLKAVRQYSEILLTKKLPEALPPIALTDTVTFGDYRLSVNNKSGIKLKKLDYKVRSRKEGDVFHPEGMTGSKKLKDFFIDKKIPQAERNLVPIIVFEDKIASVGNLRRDSGFIPGPDDEYIYLNIQKN